MKFFILYHIPEDHDSEDWPNAYSIEIDKEKEFLSLLEIRKSFPLEGVYEFSVKQAIDGTDFWVDLGDDDQQVPLKDEYIELKVFRIKIFSPKLSKIKTTPIKLPKKETAEPILLDLETENRFKEHAEEDLLFDLKVQPQKQIEEKVPRNNTISIANELLQNDWQALFDSAIGTKRETVGLGPL